MRSRKLSVTSFYGFALFLIFLNGLNAETCKSGCPKSDNGLLKFAPGNHYEYNVESLMTIENEAKHAEDIALKLSGQANLYASGNCEYTLHLDKISVIVAKESIEKQITQDLNKPVKFTLVGGELEPEICAESSDSDASLNIKRGLISLLQAAEKSHETDVYGVCPTLTSVTKVGNEEIITKVRNLNTCTYREQITNGLIKGVVNSRSEVKSSALLKSDYSKELRLLNGIPQSIHLTEEYKFAQLSNELGIAKAKVKTSLELGKVGRANAPACNGKPTSIIFKVPSAPASKNIAVLRKVFANTVNLVNEHVQGDAAQLFTELIRLMRSSDLETLIELSAEPHANKILARKVYLDALFRVGTSNAVKAIVRQFSKFSENEKKLAFLSFNLVQSIEKDALNQAATLLNPNSPNEAFLAIGNLVNKFCSHGTCDQNDVNVILKKFVDNLRHCRANTKKDEDRYVNILKGIRNSQKLSDSTTQVLVECASVEHSARLRVAAIQAFTAGACDAELQTTALKILKDHNEDSELRIEAYLAAIACPSAQLANEIAELVNNEPVYQVGGFIASSLRTIRDSTDPSREAVRHFFGNIRVTKKFPIDPNRYSYNSELSYASDTLGIGASADHSLIYSQKGFLPRTARLNLTSEIFGTNFNVLEINARQENLEQLWGQFFGPKGILRHERGNVLNNFINKPRSRRSIVDDAEKLSKKYKNYGSKTNDDMNLDLTIRLFGSEMFFMSLADNVPQEPKDIFAEFQQSFETIKNNLKHFEHEYSCHSLFLETEFSYPTGMGIPLEVSAQGTSASKLNLATDIDIDAIMSNPQKAKYRLKFEPSIDVSIIGMFGFDTSVLKAALRTTNNLHSSVGQDETFELTNEGGFGFNLDITLPRENIELIDIKHNVEFVFAEQDKETKVLPIKPKKKKSVPEENCFDQLHYIGMMFCFTSILPDTSDPTDLTLYTPMHVALRLETEKNIKIVGSYGRNPDSFLWKLKYSTPGSKVSHDTELKVEVMGTAPKSFIRGSIEHPELRLMAEAGFVNNQKEILLYNEYDVNGEKFIHKVGLSKHGSEYRPLIEVQTNKGISNEINGIRASGRIISQENGNNVRLNFDKLQVTSKDKSETVINGWAELKPFKTELKINHDHKEYDVKSHLSLENGYSAGLFVKEKNSPNTNGASIQLQLTPNSLDDTIIVALGDMNFEMQNQFEYIRKENKDLKEIKFKNTLDLKKGNVALLDATVNGEVRPKLVQFKIDLTKDRKKAAIDFNFARDQRAANDYNLNLNAKLNQHYIDLKSNAHLKGAHYITDSTLQTSWGTQLSVKGEVGEHLTAQDVLIDLQGTFIFTPKDKQGNCMLKLMTNADKSHCEFKLSRDNIDLIVFNGEKTHPQDKISNGKFNIQIKDQLVAKADFKINKNGKGDLTGLVNLKKAQRKLTIDSKFTILAPKYDIETTIGYDKDKKIYINSENILDKSKFSTKSVLDINNSKYLMDVNTVVKGEQGSNGELQGKIELTMPDGRQFEGQLSRKISTSKNGVAHGSMSASVSDKLPNNERRSIEFNGNLEKMNKKTNEYIATNNIIYTNFVGKKLDLEQKISHLLKNKFYSIDYNLKFGGELLTAPADISLIIDEYSSKHANFRAYAKYGDQINTNVNGNFALDDRAKTASYELQIDFAAPQTLIKTYNLKTSGKYLNSEIENGIGSLEIHIDQRAGDKSMKLTTVAKGNNNHGSCSLDFTSSQLEAPLKIDASFSSDPQDKKTGKSAYNFNYNYGQKSVKTSLDLSYVDSQAVRLHYVLGSLFDASKNDLDLVVLLSKTDDTTTVNSDLQLNGQKYSLESNVFSSEYKKGVTLKSTLPQKTITISGIVEKLGERKGKLILNIENLGDLDLDHTSEINLNEITDFYLSSETNSKKLKIENLSVDIRSATNSNGKGVEINVKNAKGIIINGSATFIVKQEKKKTIVEGQGIIQYYQKTNNANFKIIHELFDMAIDKEVGSALTFNGTFGPKNAVSTFKITNKNFQAKLSVCEEKKQCTNVEVRSIITVDPNDISSVQHDLMVLVDLRELGYPHEFELQSKSSRKGLKFSHEIESNIISNSNTKYQLVVSMTPPLNKFQIKLPNRDIYVETEQVLPENLLGHYQSSASFYLDRKNKPNDVTKFVASADISGVEKVAINARGQIGFESPNIRPLSINGQLNANYEQHLINSELTFDIFKTPDQKIIVTSISKNINNQGHGFNFTTENHLKSSGLGLQYEATGHAALSMDEFEFSSGYNVNSGLADIKSSAFISGSNDGLQVIFNAMNEEILKLIAEYNANKNQAHLQANFQLLNLKPLILAAELDQSSAKMSLKRAGLIDAVAEVKLGKEAKLNIDHGNKKLLAGRIALDSAHFMAQSLETNEENVKDFLKSVETISKEEAQVAKSKIEEKFRVIREAIDHQIELLKHSVPDLSPLQASLKDIQNEIENDPSIQALIENYHKYYDTILKLYKDISKSIGEAYKQISISVKETVSKIQELIKETILPIWQGFVKQLTVLLGDLQTEMVKLLTVQFEEVLKILKSIEPDLKILCKSVYETIKPIAESLQELIHTMSKDFDELLKDLKEYVSKLPTFETIEKEFKKQLAQLKVVDEILNFLRNILDQANSIPGFNELSELAKKLYDYIEAKLRGYEVNDIESVEGIANAALKVLNSILKRWTDVGAPIPNLLSPVPLSLDLVRNLPVWISFRFSLFNYLINEKLDLMSDLVEILRPQFDILAPFDLTGHIVDGKHIITFDERQYGFQGSCKYVIAQNIENNYFSLIGLFKDGKLKSLTLIDSKNYIEMSDNGALKFNGKQVEYPVHEENLHAWRKFYTLRMRNDDSIEIVCTSDLKVCHVTVDGFYSSKIRGLLGNGNAEPYDDFINVEGKISANLAEFVNEYKLGNCPAINAKEPDNVEHDSICSELFAYDSSLVLGYLFQNPLPYRQACDEAVQVNSGNKEEIACNIAMSYSSAIRLKGLPISLPSRCLKCSGAVGQREIGDEFTSKVPTNKADVVFVVDMGASSNVIENLITPALSEIRNQLKVRGMTDVQIAVVAFKDDQLYPALLTSNGGKINYNGKLNSLTLKGPQRPEPLNIKDGIVKNILNWIEKFEREIEQQPDEAAFELAMEYPFRAGAAKAIIAVRSEQLDAIKYLKSRLLAALTEFEGASIHLIAPVKDIAIEGYPTEKLVGFNSRIVATTEGKDAKKRQKLQFKKDIGTDFVLENNGWVFALQNFDALSADDQKKAYLNQVTSSISDTLFKTETVSECKCVKSHGLHAEHKCKIVSSNFLPNKRPKGA